MPVHIEDNRSGNPTTDNVMAIFEDSWHDNAPGRADNFDDSEEVVLYMGIRNTTVDMAVKYANQTWPSNDVTLYIYDIGDNNYADYDSIVIRDGKCYLTPKI